MDEDDERKPLIIFGRDVTMIPCFRQSFLYGFGSGIVGALATFMLTSKPRIASHIGWGTFVGTTWSYWMYCRYNWSRQQLEASQLRMLMEQHNAYQGTPRERELQEPESPQLVEV